MNKKIYFLSLGCPRNLVDSEVMMGILEKTGFTITHRPEKSHMAVINTCSFIDEATEETIETILNICQLKKNGEIKKIIVCGCLVQHFGRQLMTELPEIDAFIGTNEISKIGEVAEGLLKDKRIFCCFENKDFIYNSKLPRFSLTPGYSRYLKISEGCNHGCSYCLIYKLKGRHRSRPMKDIINEAQNLARLGCRELNIIGQDTSYYGFDLYGRETLSDLLKELAKIEDIHWIRLLYAHPAGFSEKLIRTILSSPKICNYADIPMQHINSRILKLMNRPTLKKDIINLIKTLRKFTEEIFLRTTLLVGFPTEAERDFEELLQFMQWAKFERLGIFEYSRQENTPAASLKKQVPQAIKRRRFRKAFKLQQKIAREVNSTFMGKTLEVIIEEAKENFYIGRTAFDAPEVDGLVYVSSDEKLKPGSFVDVTIKDTLEYDLAGERVILK